MPIRKRVLVVASVLGGLVVALPAATVTMPLAEVRAGMRGTGVTVFAGTERSEFDAEIIGVLENSFGPRQNLILARLDGGPLAKSGVIQGMSGSPVYIEDRLIGAVSYALGSFTNDTIAGITPIDEMLRADTSSPRAASVIPELALPLSTELLTTLLLMPSGPVDRFATRPRSVHADGIGADLDAAIGTELRPIATPVVMSGFAPPAFEQIAGRLRGTGLVAVVGGTTSGVSTQPSDDPLQPGDAVGVSLMQGDLSMAGTGTVTMVEAGRLYAFGHPFYNLGPSSFPMTRAYVHTVLSSQAISSRIATVGETLGTIDQDRSTGISGAFGAGPGMVPVHIDIEAAESGHTGSFDFEVVDDELFTPLLVYN
ncbi:MAG: SpoIVB peptidase S55 domain-containing protein, partial [Acidobacteriota bacterium]|nr:SpoIVB peptidase S55 domain-containing protein [Acidobacteriota bacterium]